MRFLPAPTVLGSLIFGLGKGEEVVVGDAPEGLSIARGPPSGLVEGLVEEKQQRLIFEQQNTFSSVAEWSVSLLVVIRISIF